MHMDWSRIIIYLFSIKVIELIKNKFVAFFYFL